MGHVSVRIDTTVEGVDAEVAEASIGHLREELLGLDVDAVEPMRSGPLPTGAKSGAELAVLGTLLVSVPRSAVLSAVVEIIKSWLGRGGGRTARLEIDGDVLDLEGLSSSQQGLLIEQWIARHDVSDN